MRTNSIRILKDVLALAAEIAETEHVTHAEAFRRAKVEYRRLYKTDTATTYRPIAVSDPRLRWRVVEREQ